MQATNDSGVRATDDSGVQATGERATNVQTTDECDVQTTDDSNEQATNESEVKDVGILDAGNLSSELIAVVNWHKLGINLGLPKYELDKIQQDYAHLGNDRQRLEMLDKWLQRTPNATWRDVVRALQQMGENRVAESIRQKDKGRGK